MHSLVRDRGLQTLEKSLGAEWQRPKKEGQRRGPSTESPHGGFPLGHSGACPIPAPWGHSPTRSGPRVAPCPRSDGTDALPLLLPGASRFSPLTLPALVWVGG